MTHIYQFKRTLTLCMHAFNVILIPKFFNFVVYYYACICRAVHSWPLHHGNNTN